MASNNPNLTRTFTLSNLEIDGRSSDRTRDPPSQQSIYIPPGDYEQETYRLSTFENFPVASPISRKDLAKNGFYFLGYLDRVKCFSCARSVEKWVITDSPSDRKWHKPTCPFMRGEPTGNTPILNLTGSLAELSGSTSGQEKLRKQNERVKWSVSRHLSLDANLARPLIAKQDESSLNPVGNPQISSIRGPDIPPSVARQDPQENSSGESSNSSSINGVQIQNEPDLDLNSELYRTAQTTGREPDQGVITLSNLEIDGRSSDRTRDPPSQQSIYIPPGESFNLSSINGDQIQNEPVAIPQASEVPLGHMATVASQDHRTFYTDLDLDLNRQTDRQDGSNN